MCSQDHCTHIPVVCSARADRQTDTQTDRQTDTHTPVRFFFVGQGLTDGYIRSRVGTISAEHALGVYTRVSAH